MFPKHFLKKAILFTVLMSLPVIMANPLFAGEITSPSKGSSERSAILDTIRPLVQKRLKNQDLIFVVTTLLVKDGWAFVNAKPHLKNGAPIDYKGTEFEQAQRDGVFDEWVGALLKKENGAWRIIDLVIGDTDFPPAEWPEKYGAPKELIYHD